MSFVSDMFGSSPEKAQVDKPATVAQANEQYAQTQGTIAQQQEFVNALTAQGGLANQSNVYQQLAGIANGTGPTVAQNQLNQATSQNVANQAALIAGARGSSANAGMMARQAAQQGANVQQQAVGQAATLRAQEQQAALQQMGGLATNQVNQQAQGLSTLNQQAQNAQNLTYNAITGQNNANVAMQSNINDNNSKQLPSVMSAVGGALGGVASSLIPTATDAAAKAVGTGASQASGGGTSVFGFKYAEGGEVPGKAPLPGKDHPANDIVDAKLSPGEIVIPLSVLEADDPAKAAALFVEGVLAGKGPKPKEAPAAKEKQALADGGQVQAPQDWFSKLERGAASLAEPLISPFTHGSGKAAHDAYQQSVVNSQISNSPAQALKQPEIQSELGQKYSPEVLQMNFAGQSQPQPQQMPQVQPQQSDPMGYGSQMGSVMGGIGQMQSGIRKQGESEALLARSQADIGRQQAEEARSMQAHYNEQYQVLNAEREQFKQQLLNGKIDPNNYMNSMSDGKKVSTTIGLILGGLSGGLMGTENPAVAMLNKQIDRDIDAQKAQLGKTQNLLTMNMQQFGNLKDATMATKAMMADVYAAKLTQAAGEAGSEAAKARALQAAGKLQLDTAPLLQQIAMRKAMMSGMQNGRIAPESVVRSLVPEGQQQAAFKELGEAQELTKFRDNALRTFDKIAQLNNVANRATSPIQSRKQIAALKEPLVAELSKTTAGRFTEQDAEMLDVLFSGALDNDKTVSLKRNQLVHMIDQKMNFPLLKAYGIDTSQMGSMNSRGQARIQEKPVK